jgi:putative endonuclease
VAAGGDALFTAVPAKAGTHQAASAVFYVYLLSSQPHGTVYVGKTTDLLKRVWEHKNKVVSSFTAKYGVDRLVWFEVHESLEAAFRREKQIKSWKRTWKIQLIEKDNPDWVDLYGSLSP